MRIGPTFAAKVELFLRENPQLIKPAPGPAGADGAQGDVGPTGPSGGQGPSGSQGPAGAQGPVGNTGSQGPAGSDGAPGAQGPQGVQGPQGATGAQGPAGANGATGATGPQGPAGASSFTTVEKDLGALPRYSGTFDLPGLNGLTPTKPVMVQQAAAAYTGKGTLTDEAEMDQLSLTGFVLDASTIRVYWTVPIHNGPVAGNFKFDYLAGA